MVKRQNTHADYSRAMLNRLNNFLKSLSAETDVNPADKITIEIACAVLLCEVMQADHHIDQQEQDELLALLQNSFHLSPQEAQALIEQSLSQSQASNDLYTYTSLINKQYQTEEKIALVKTLWQLALADGEISSIEHHIIRKIADLLHLRHSEYVASKPSLG